MKIDSEGLPIFILAIFMSALIFLQIGYLDVIGFREHEDSTLDKYVTSYFNLNFTYGDSILRSGSRSINGIFAEAIMIPKGNASITLVNGTISFFFDGVSVKTTNLTANGGRISVDSEEIIVWDNEAYVNHNITAVLNGRITLLSGNDTKSFDVFPIKREVIVSFTSHMIWRLSNRYYATGGLNSTNFPQLWNMVHVTLKPGDTVYFAGNTEYIADRTISLTRDKITLIGLPGATIRSYSSRLNDFLFECTGDNVTIRGLRFNGLGLADNLDQLYPYQLIQFNNVNNLVLENCTIEHHKQYLIQFSNCNNFIVRNCLVRYGQNGIATYGKNSGGVIENNLITDCSQGPIKLRGCTSTIVRNNTIHLEYTYWRSFNHFRYPGPDGRGITLHDATQGSQGIYFGVTDPQPNFNCDVYNNTLIDASVHGTIKVKDVIDGTMRDSPSISIGCWFPQDASSTKSNGNIFRDNFVDGAYYGVWVDNHAKRSPQPLSVYSNNTFVNIVKNICYIIDYS